MCTGDVIYLSVVGRPIVVLNSAEAARDLMDKRSANYSDRPRIVVIGEMYHLFPHFYPPLVRPRLIRFLIRVLGLDGGICYLSCVMGIDSGSNGE